MGLYRRGKIYWFTIMQDGKRIQVSTKTDNKRLAEAIYAKAKTEVIEGRWFENQAKKHTLKDMFERYETEYTEHKDYYQKARDKTVFKHLYAYFGEASKLSDVESRIGGYEQWRKSKGKKPATILKELGLLRRIFNIARKQWKWKIQNPVSEIELPKVRNERVRYLTTDEYGRLLKALDETDEKWIKPVVILALDTGLRLSNLCNLLWLEVNLFNRVITINADKMKNDDYIGIPLTDRAYETLKELQRVRSLSDHVFHNNGQNLYDRKVQRAFKRVLKKAEIENFRFHDMRHTFASYLRQRGEDLHTIAVLMGHRDLRMTKRYAHLSTESLRRAISKLNDTATFLLQSDEIRFAESS